MRTNKQIAAILFSHYTLTDFNSPRNDIPDTCKPTTAKISPYFRSNYLLTISLKNGGIFNGDFSFLSIPFTKIRLGAVRI
jgi:hypothetical protein